MMLDWPLSGRRIWGWRSCIVLRRRWRVLALTRRLRGRRRAGIMAVLVSRGRSLLRRMLLCIVAALRVTVLSRVG